MKEIEVQSKSEEIVFQPHPKDKRFRDRTGIRRGLMTVLGYAGKRYIGSHSSEWWAKCDCGTVKKVFTASIDSFQVKSCGCVKRKKDKERYLRHGMVYSPEYAAWSKLKSRCLNASDKAYKYYGGRGIKVCERWACLFENFYEDMGPRPSEKHSIDRINGDGDYEPGNCRWASRTVQNRNRKCNRFIEFNGKTQCISEWEAELGFPPRRVSDRLSKGWTESMALSTPVVRKPKSPSQTACTDQSASLHHQACHA